MPTETYDQKKSRLQKMKQKAEKEWENLLIDIKNFDILIVNEIIKRMNNIEYDIYKLELEENLRIMYFRAEREQIEKDFGTKPKKKKKGGRQKKE